MTLTELYRECTALLKQGEIENPAFEAQCLIEKVFGIDRVYLIAHGDSKADGDKEQPLFELVRRRLQREPLQYILGQWSFMGFDFKVGAGVLIPRDDTEVVTNLCLEFLDTRQSKNTVDLCSGSGTIAVALNKIASASVTAIELSDDAFAYLEQNIKLNNSDVKAVHGNILTCHKDFDDNSLDLIVSNPPYIISNEIPALQAEVQKEPAMALDGGTDGYEFYRSIISNWSSKLKSGGALAFELGEGQADTVKSLMSAEGFDNFIISDDFGGIQRAIIGTVRRK